MSGLSFPKAVFFDWDGTAVDSFAFILAAHNHAREQLGLDTISQEQYAPYFGMPRDDIYQGLYSEHAQAALELFGEYVKENHLTDLKPMPGMESLLEALTDLNIKIGVVSNKKGLFIRQEIEGFGWENYFSAVIGSGDVPEDKPSALPLLTAIKQSDIEEISNDIWYIGDTEIDLACAYNAGCTAIFVTNGHELPVWEDKYAPSAIVKNCTELQELLLQYAQK